MDMYRIKQKNNSVKKMLQFQQCIASVKNVRECGTKKTKLRPAL